MFRGRDDRDEIERSAVHVTLIRQSLERVALTLDFVAVNTTVDDGEIDETGIVPVWRARRMKPDLSENSASWNWTAGWLRCIDALQRAV
jgi:hypothetical protein